MSDRSDYLTARFARAAVQDAIRLRRPHTAREFRQAVDEILAEHQLIELPPPTVAPFDAIYPDGWHAGDPERPWG